VDVTLHLDMVPADQTPIMNFFDPFETAEMWGNPFIVLGNPDVWLDSGAGYIIPGYLPGR
jgi:hypothetical protein